MSIARDAGIAAALYLTEHLRALPADEGRVQAFFAAVIEQAVRAALQQDRQKRPARNRRPRPSKN